MLYNLLRSKFNALPPRARGDLTRHPTGEARRFTKAEAKVLWAERVEANMVAPTFTEAWDGLYGAGALVHEAKGVGMYLASV